MKVNEHIKSGMERVPIGLRNASPGALKFSEIVTSEGQRLHKEQLNRLLAEITTAGERLGQTRNFKELSTYKHLVKRFVKEAVEFGMELKQSHSWNRFAEGKALQIVETIDQKLIELTDELVSAEKESIELLGTVGEVKGLLIELYI